MIKNAEINSGQGVALPLKYGAVMPVNSVLTGIAIVALPTSEADALAAWAATIVAEVVISRPA